MSESLAVDGRRYLLHPAHKSARISHRKHRWPDSEAELSTKEEWTNSDSESDSAEERGSDCRKIQPRHAPQTRLYMRMGIGVVVAILLIALLWWLGPDAMDSLTSKGGSGGQATAPSHLQPSAGEDTLHATIEETNPVKKPSQSAEAEQPASKTAVATSTSKFNAKEAEATAATQAKTSKGNKKGMFGVVDPICGPSGAVEKSGPGVGPNGAQSWLNCGLSEQDKDAPWTPPHIEISQLKYIELEEAVKLEPFKACSQWVDLFNNVGKETKLPPVFLASIAMTESSCRGDAVAPGGASWGLMQITTDKCSDAPGGDCNNPEFNVKRGADYFNTVLKERGGFLQALGAYNGWVESMTWNKATAIAAEAYYLQSMDTPSGPYTMWTVAEPSSELEKAGA
ncbi:hypothetical protein OIV83_001452 [Microbotryomycetes sp. JL201]|nr:hypothetical protein OIV83_001452 [Microbotryomycetes sp. JL201]